MPKAKLYTKHRTKQRSDIALTLDIANALVGLIMNGKNLYSQDILELEVPDAEQDIKLLKISRGTLNSWLTRRNIIPDTEDTLFAVLEQAKSNYRIKKSERRKEKVIELAEQKLSRLMHLRTSQVVRNSYGQTIQRQDGSIVKKENVQLLKTQVDAIKFVLERLNPEVYGRNQEKVIVNNFSLADLRREKERQSSGSKNRQ